MRVYTCNHEWGAMLTAIYEANASRLGHNNIRFEIEPVGQYSLFDEYVHVEYDADKVSKVIDALNSKISPYFYQQLFTTSMSNDEDVLDNIYKVMLLGFSYGGNVLKMLQYSDIMRNAEICKRVKNEANRFQEIMRFHKIGEVYISHFEPKNRVIEYLGGVFQDRMPSEHFIIVDDVHSEAVVHKKNENFYLQRLNEEELYNLLKTEKVNDEYTDLWKVFFDTIAIKERINPKCQMNHFPIWARKHAVEFK